MNKFIEYRREFHKYPEIGWREFRTSARIAQVLKELGYEVVLGTDVVDTTSVGSPEQLDASVLKEEMERAISQGADRTIVEAMNGYPAVMVIIDSGIEGPVTALRFEMDALPYEEVKRKGYRPYDQGYISCNKNAVHACGHDGHSAMGIGIAETLLENVNEYKGKIKLFFQPAEESFYGAQAIVDKGHLDDCDYFIAMHLSLSVDNRPLKSHEIACGCKDFLSARQLDVFLRGKAAHPCGASQEGKNAILAACSAILNIHSIAPHEKGLGRVNVGEISGGVAPNTIPPNAMFKIEYRGEDNEISAYLGDRIFEILDGTAKAYGIEYDYIDYGEVPAAKSDDKIMQIIENSAKEVPWFRKIYFEGNVGGSDDAAVMINKVQENGGFGTYVGIGADTTQTLHNPEFDFDEDAIIAGIDLAINALDNIHSK